MRARQWTLAAYPQVETRETDFALADVELPELADGEALVKVGVIGLAPSLRFRMTPGGAGLPGMALGDPITAASGVGVVLASRRSGLAAGDLVYGDVGWTDYANVGRGRYLVPIGRAGAPLSNPRGVLGESSAYRGGPYRLEDYVGLLGGAATAAWIGLRLVDARAGETVVVTAGAGGIGHIVCQLARMMGLTAVALTRDAGKIAWLRDSIRVPAVLDASRPEAIEQVPIDYDILFENAGGVLMQPLLARIAKHGRVALCGVIAEYETGRTTPFAMAPLVFRNVTLRGYFADDHLPMWGPALDTIGRWLSEDKLVRGYDMEDGLERLPQAYLRLFRGRTNRGKLMLRVADL